MTKMSRERRTTTRYHSNDSVFAAALVSVIIPCFNQAHFLGEAITSVLAQTYPHFELIVVDDGSTDKTSEVATAYPGVRCIRQENQGLAAARNTALCASHGAYLVFLDADDRLLPQALEAGVRHVQTVPDCAFVAGHFRYINSDGSQSKEDAQKSVAPDPYLAFLQGNYIAMHATVMYRRVALEAVGGFDPSLAACEDYDMYLRLAREFPVVRYDEVVAEYRQHAGNMSRDPAFMLQTALAVLRAQWRHAKASPSYRRAYRTGSRGWQAHYGAQLLTQAAYSWAHGDKRLAVQTIVILLRYGSGYLLRYGVRRCFERGARMLHPICPLSVYRLWRQLHRDDYVPPVGRVRFGDLRRLTPLSREFGYDRGLPVDRYYIENFLARQQDDIRGRVLEVGDNSYTRRFGGTRVTTSDVLHVLDGNPTATIIADLTHADHIPSQVFDCIILTQTLHLIYDVRAAVHTLYRILKPGGILLATVPGISQLSIDEWADSWYWAFTLRAVRQLFTESFAPENLQTDAYGNVLAATAFLNGLAAEELCQEELDASDPHYQLLITIRAVKLAEPLSRVC
jgi:glycosyltransferase involved in cell wall biosynthesis